MYKYSGNNGCEFRKIDDWQEIDLACAPYTGSNGRDVMELAVYITGDGFNILEKYPVPERSINGIFQVFSLQVSTA